MGTPAPDPARLADVLRQGGEPAVTALLEAHGVALHEYFRLMLGNESAVTRALTDTVVAALAHVGRLTDPRRLRAWLLALARVKAHEFYPAGWDEIAERYLGSLRGRPPAPDPPDDVLAVITDAALLRMWPEQRELFIIGAPRYQVPPAELAAIFGLVDEHQAAALHTEAAGSFWQALERSASDVGYVLPAHAHRRAATLIGASTVPVMLSQIVPFCTDPGFARLREDISARAGQLGIDGFPMTSGLTWPAAEPGAEPGGGAGHDAWPATEPAERRWDRKRMLIAAAAGTGILAAVSVPIALAATILLSAPPVRGAPTQPAAPTGSSAAPSATQDTSVPNVSSSPTPAGASVAPAATTPAARRTSSSPPRSVTTTRPSAQPSPTAARTSPPATSPPSPSPTPTPTVSTPPPHRGKG